MTSCPANRQRSAIARRKIKARAFWRGFSDWLRHYKDHCSPNRLYCFQWREGWYVLLVSALLLLAIFVATTSRSVALAVAVTAVYPLFDTVVVNTAIVYSTGRGIHPLRSALLTMTAYFNVTLSFAPWWLLLGPMFPEIHRLGRSFIIPAIVTTSPSPLYTLRYKPTDIPLETGSYDDVDLREIEQIPWVRFRKMLTAHAGSVSRTVLVVNAAALSEFLDAIPHALG